MVPANTSTHDFKNQSTVNIDVWDNENIISPNFEVNDNFNTMTKDNMDTTGIYM